MTEPHHVALVHEGRVLVDETGALPFFMPDRHLGSLTRALELVGASVVTAPAAKLPDGRWVRRAPLEQTAQSRCQPGLPAQASR